eukprot:2269842-Alexandrium_andersonii.AAC.1
MAPPSLAARLRAGGKIVDVEDGQDGCRTPRTPRTPHRPDHRLNSKVPEPADRPAAAAASGQLAVPQTPTAAKSKPAQAKPPTAA